MPGAPILFLHSGKSLGQRSKQTRQIRINLRNLPLKGPGLLFQFPCPGKLITRLYLFQFRLFRAQFNLQCLVFASELIDILLPCRNLLLHLPDLFNIPWQFVICFQFILHRIDRGNKFIQQDIQVLQAAKDIFIFLRKKCLNILLAPDSVLKASL